MSIYNLITEAVRYFSGNGFESQEELDFWLEKLYEELIFSPGQSDKLNKTAKDHLTSIYTKLVERKGVLTTMPKEIQAFTIENIKPSLQAELDMRISASANLIKLNREQSIAKTLQRFSGWATSIPAGGSDIVDKNKVKENIKKPISSMKYEERRVIIDQGHKLNSSIKEIVAVDSGAIAAKWRSKWRQSNYNYREDHKERDEKYYIIKNNWAITSGLIKKGLESTEDITRPGEEVYCRCTYEYIFYLQDLPKEMLTKKGIEKVYGDKK